MSQNWHAQRIIYIRKIILGHVCILGYYSEEIVNIINTKKSELKLELVGSWTVLAGDTDQALHLWRYSGGYDSVDRTQVELGKDKVWKLKIYIYVQ